MSNEEQNSGSDASSHTAGGQSHYAVRLTDEHWDELRAWREHDLNTLLAFLRDHASRTPTALIPGRLKLLHEPFRGHYQLSIGRRLRLIYRVDEVRRLVVVEYVGQHPDWRRSRRRGRITR